MLVVLFDFLQATITNISITDARMTVGLIFFDKNTCENMILNVRNRNIISKKTDVL